jgi:ribosomal protein S18 acetylase RimI-like enzyme
MEYSILPFTGVDQAMLGRVAALHQAVMHNLMGDLGLPILLRYYEYLRADASLIGFIALSGSGELAGWVVGSPDPNRLNNRLWGDPVWLLAQFARLLFTRPRVILELAAAQFYSSGQVDVPGAIELTYIGTAPAAQHQGVGRALLSAFLETSRSAGYCCVLLSAERDNQRALSLYTRAGFSIKKTMTEGRFERYRMEMKLPSHGSSA